MQTWQPLKPGDIVDLVAPSRACIFEDIEKALDYIRSLELIPRIPEDIIGPSLPFLANTDEYRFQHLKRALQAEDSKAIWCLLGGYGSMRLIPYLETFKSPRQPKLFIGFSDITALHLFFTQRWHWATLHGPMPKHLGNQQLDSATMQYMQQVIFGEARELNYNGLTPLNAAAKQSAVIEAPVTGGNLSVAQCSTGTSWQMETKGRIVMLEDIGERGYSISRMLEHLSQAGIFKEAAAIILGAFTQDQEEDGTSTTSATLKDFGDRIPIPLLKCEWFGHGETNYPVPLGIRAELRLGAAASLTIPVPG